MTQSLNDALKEACKNVMDTGTLVRVVLSGRRRNMATEFDRIDIRPVEIRGIVHFQLTYHDGGANTTKNLLPDSASISGLLMSGYANILVENTNGSMSIRITKSGGAQVHFENKELRQDLSHDKQKVRLLDRKSVV